MANSLSTPRSVCIHLFVCLTLAACWCTAGTFGTRLLSVLRPCATLKSFPPFSPRLCQYLRQRNNTTREMSRELAGHKCTHIIFCPLFSPSLSPVSLTFLSGMALSHALSTTLGYSMLAWPCRIVSFVACLSVITLHYLCCIAFRHPFLAMEQSRQISLTVTTAVRLCRGWKWD